MPLSTRRRTTPFAISASALITVAVSCCALICQSASASADDEAIEFFEKKIRPVLVERCFKCHSSGAEKVKGELRLDQRATMLIGGNSGPAVVPGKPDASLLISAIAWNGSVSEMPPDGKLPNSVVANFRQWIARGAAFPESPAATIVASPDKPRPIDIAQGKQFWSFQPLRLARGEDLATSTWSRRRIDAFVLAKLEQEKLTAAAEADRRALIRRLSFDLRGVPPTWEEVREFTESDAPDAVERLVDRYLASPRYGEHWARHWLDVARYAEDNPTSEATCKPPRFPFRYRDWVIRAINDDLPYREFVRRQLAADLLDLPAEEIAATGFLGLSPVYHKEPKLAADVISIIVADEWDERLDTITRGFLGLTAACARCHDHKFDPIKMDDYYSLASVLASTQLVEWPLVPTDPATAAALTETQRQIVDVELRVSYAKNHRDTAKREGVTDLAPYEAELTRWQETLKSLKETKLFDGPIANAVRDAGLWINGEDRAWTVLDYRPQQERDLPIFLRGNPANHGRAMQRRFLEVLSSPATDGQTKAFSQGSGRRELADAIVQDAGPLAARVFVNRVWGWHFDRPLVNTPSNFGRLGDAPSHPELLDDLAARFVAADWSLKWLQREIVLSSTWRQVSDSQRHDRERDPYNRWLSRMNRRRLEAETLRDAVLTVSGEMSSAMFGPSEKLDDPKSRRRTIYGTVSRQKPADLLRLFDFPDAKSHAEIRQPTTTPLQQLYLLNSPFLQQQAAAIAARLMREQAADSKASDPATMVRQLFAEILLRTPSDVELAESLALVRAENENADTLRAETDAATKTVSEAACTLLAHSLLATNEFLYVD